MSEPTFIGVKVAVTQLVMSECCCRRTRRVRRPCCRGDVVADLVVGHILLELA